MNGLPISACTKPEGVRYIAKKSGQTALLLPARPHEIKPGLVRKEDYMERIKARPEGKGAVKMSYAPRKCLVVKPLY